MPCRWASTLRSCWRRDAHRGGRSRSRRLPRMPSRTVAAGPTCGARVTAQLRLEVDGAGLAGMEVSRGRSVERSRLAWLSNRLPPCWGWLPNDVPACRGLAVAWLKRGVSAARSWNWACPLRSLPAGREGACFHGGSDDRGRSAQGLAYGGDDQRGGGAAG